MKEATLARELVDRLGNDPARAPRGDAAPEPPPLPPSDHIVHRADLAYLNRRWIWSGEPEAASRGWFPFDLRRRLKARLARFLASSIESYFIEERAFVERLVRFQNDVAKNSDQLSEEIRQVAAAERSLVAWMQDRFDELSRRNEALHSLLEARVERLEASRDAERKPTC